MQPPIPPPPPMRAQECWAHNKENNACFSKFDVSCNLVYSSYSPLVVSDPSNLKDSKMAFPFLADLPGAFGAKSVFGDEKISKLSSSSSSVPKTFLPVQGMYNVNVYVLVYVFYCLF